MKMFRNDKKKKLESLIQTIRIYSQDIAMEFGIEEWSLLIMRNGNRLITEGTQLRNQKKI